jgi:hypothetical protein
MFIFIILTMRSIAPFEAQRQSNLNPFTFSEYYKETANVSPFRTYNTRRIDQIRTN